MGISCLLWLCVALNFTVQLGGEPRGVGDQSVGCLVGAVWAWLVGLKLTASPNPMGSSQASSGASCSYRHISLLL